jgi:hypothetical protein
MTQAQRRYLFARLTAIPPVLEFQVAAISPGVRRSIPASTENDYTSRCRQQNLCHIRRTSDVRQGIAQRAHRCKYRTS